MSYEDLRFAEWFAGLVAAALIAAVAAAVIYFAVRRGALAALRQWSRENEAKGREIDRLAAERRRAEFETRAAKGI